MKRTYQSPYEICETCGHTSAVHFSASMYGPRCVKRPCECAGFVPSGEFDEIERDRDQRDMRKRGVS